MLRLPNDILFIFHSYFDTGRSFLSWARRSERLHFPDHRRRLAQMITVSEPATSIVTTDVQLSDEEGLDEERSSDDQGKCSDPTCTTGKRRQVHLPWHPDATATLAKVFARGDLHVGPHQPLSNRLVTLLRDTYKLRDIELLPIIDAAEAIVLPKAMRQLTKTTKSPYAAVHACLIEWDTCRPGHRRGVPKAMKAMSEALQYLSYQTEEVIIPRDAGWIGHDGWVGQQMQRFVNEHGSKGNLVIVYYDGHGGANKHLLGSAFRGPCPGINLTRLQTLLRDRCEADVLLVLDCCDAGFMPEYQEIAHLSLASPPDHNIETLAACPSKASCYLGGRHNFTDRLAGQLILHAREKGMSVDQYNTILAHDWRYRAGKDTPERREVTGGNVRFLICGSGSILLERLQPAVKTQQAREEVDLLG